MIDVIIRILKIIIVALNRKNLLSGKDNNKLNKEFDKYRELEKSHQEKMEIRAKAKSNIRNAFDKFKDATEKTVKSLNSADN